MSLGPGESRRARPARHATIRAVYRSRPLAPSAVVLI
jgi:hypothetical protein